MMHPDLLTTTDCTGWMDATARKLDDRSAVQLTEGHMFMSLRVVAAGGHLNQHHSWGLNMQVRSAKKAEVQSQKRAEKAAKEAAAREADLRSYSHILKVGVYFTHTEGSCL